jgi:ribosomal protein L37AE/L43A
LSLASVRKSLSFVVTPEDWKLATLLGKNSFNRGKKECVKRGLLSYKRQKLTLNDPVTRKPSVKTRGERIIHADPKWKFSLDAIKPEEWQKIAERALNREFTVNASGWTHSRADNLCPFCQEPRAFTMNFERSQWKCHHCEEKGRMFQLVQRVLRETQPQRVRDFISETLAEKPVTQELVSVAGDHSGI